MLKTLLTALTLIQAAQAYAIGSFSLETREAVVDNSTTPGLRLQKRAGDYHGRATWYEAGMGACGQVNNSGQPIVALGQVIWDQKASSDGNSNNNGWCWQWITISYGGKQVPAQIVDLCPYSGGCSASDGAALDMSQSLFTKFADLGVGVFYMDWWVGTGDNSDDKPKAKAQGNNNNNDNDDNDNDNDEQAQQRQQQLKEQQAAAASSSSAAAARASASSASVASVRSASMASVASASSRAAYLASLASESQASVASASAAAQASRQAVSIKNDGNIQAVNTAVLNLAGVLGDTLAVFNK